VPEGLAAAVSAELDRLAPAGAVLGVAVSGGSDSTALLIFAARWARARGRSLVAATVDHGLRPESAAEAQTVTELCASLGIGHATLRAEGLGAEPGNLPAAARDARYALLGGWARERALGAVLLGHTLDDQAETVLMRLARGSGAEGLSGIEAARRHDGLLWLRPLLGMRRQALRKFLEAEGVRWIEDPTNGDPAYDRVKARRALAALAPLGIDAGGLAETARRLRRQRRVLERAMERLADRARLWGALGEARLDLGTMAADEPDTALRLVADTLCRISGADYRPRFRALSGLVERILAGDESGATLAGCLIRPGRGVALVCREAAACAPDVTLAPGATDWDRRWRLRTTGTWPAGARVGALGEAGLAALREAAKSGAWQAPDGWSTAPRAVRLTTPAIRSGTGALVAAPLAGYLDAAGTGPDRTVSAENLAPARLR